MVTGSATVSEDGMFVVSGSTNTRDTNITMSKKPSIGDFGKNALATGLNDLSVVVGAVDIVVPEVPVAPVGNALSGIGAALGTRADLVANDGELSAGGAAALAVAGAGALSPEPVSGTIFDVIGLGLAVDSTVSSAKAAADGLSRYTRFKNGGGSDWERTVEEISGYVEDVGTHYLMLETGVLGLREVLDAAPNGTSDPALVEKFLQSSALFIEGQTFFETRGGGSIFIVLSKVSQDFKDWQAHFDELHGPGFVITADAPFRVTVAQGQEVYRGITNGAG